MTQLKTTGKSNIRKVRLAYMIQVTGLLFWLLAVPYCIGLIPGHFLSAKKRTTAVTFLAGYLLMWAVFEMITVPAVILIQYHNFSFVLRLFMITALLLSAAGLMLGYWRRKETYVWQKKPLLSDLRQERVSVETKAAWGLFFAVLAFQLYMALTRASFDGDDAYYVVQSLMAQQNGAMYRNLPYTGRSSVLDVRHVLAVFPMWIAFVAVKADLHATIVSHTVMPLLLIPLGYLVYYEIAKALFGSHREKIPFFMIVMAMLQMFGNVSIYTNETFFLTRTWQGKSVAGNFVIPMLFLLLLWIFDREQKEWRDWREPDEEGVDAGLWVMLVCLHVTAGMCSSIAVFLLVILLAIAAFCLMLTEWDIRIPFKLGLTCIPSAVYVVIYLIISR